MNIIDEFFIQFKSNAADVKKGVVDAQKATDQFEERLSKTDETTGKLAVSFSKLVEAGIGALAGFAALDKLKDAILGTIDFNAQIEKTSRLTDMNARELSIWNGVVARAGGDPGSKEYLNFITKLNQQYAGLGVNQRIKYVNRDLGELADKIKQLNDASPGSGYALAQKLGLGDDLYLALKDGKAALEGMIAAQSKLDNTTQQSSQAAFEFEQNLQDIGTQARSLFNILAPGLEKILEYLVEVAKYWGLVATGIELAANKAASWFGLGSMFSSTLPTTTVPAPPAGSVYGGAGTPLGIRSNNPGNLRPGGVEAVYPTQQAGLDAEQAQLRRYGARGINTVSSIISTWAPPSENNTPAYITAVSRATGYNTNQQLDLNDPQVVARLSNAINAHENGAAYGNLIPTAQNAIGTANATQVPSAQGGKSITIGAITINTQATDADGIARELPGALNTHLKDTVGSFDDGVAY